MLPQLRVNFFKCAQTIFTFQILEGPGAGNHEHWIGNDVRVRSLENALIAGFNDYEIDFRQHLHCVPLPEYDAPVALPAQRDHVRCFING